MGRAEKTPRHLLAPQLVPRIRRIPGYGGQMVGSGSKSLYEDPNAPSPAGRGAGRGTQGRRATQADHQPGKSESAGPSGKSESAGPSGKSESAGE
jgi:hypothetical protein